MNRFLYLSIAYLALTVLWAGLPQSSKAQYYYKDLLETRQTIAGWRLLRDNKVRSIRINSFESDGQPSEGFEGQQDISSDDTRITTHTRSHETTESWLIVSYSPDGLLQKTLDTSNTYLTSTEYTYNAKGLLLSLRNTSLETDNQRKEIEEHNWQYDAQGLPTLMMKIRNGNDTTTIRFIKDEKGNIAEERASRRHQNLPTVYYYYDTTNRLTDIVRYNAAAGRLLPDRIFTYDASSRLHSMIVVPEGSNEYQRWVYEYDDKGLKARESCFTKRRQLVGRVEYQYSFK